MDNKRIKVLAISPDRTGTGYFRSLKPHLKINQLFSEEFDVEIIDQKQMSLKTIDDYKNYNIIHFSKNLFTDLLDVDKLDKESDIYKNIIRYKDLLNSFTEKNKEYEMLLTSNRFGNNFLNKLKKELNKLLKELKETENLIPKYGNLAEIFVNELKNSGVKFIMDLDDYWEISITHPLYNRFSEIKYKEIVLKYLKLADYVTTTTEVFANEIRKFNKEVIVIPNSIDRDESQWVIKDVPSKRVRIMWAGGIGHERDLETVKTLVNKLKTDGLINKVQFLLCGFDLRNVNNPNECTWSKYEKIFTDNYTTISEDYKKYLLSFNNDIEYPNIENEPYRRVWSKTITSYATNYNMADICLAPLEKCKFTSMKSQLKIIEAGWFKKPIVASNVLPYTLDVINVYNKNGVLNVEDGNGFLYNNEKELYKYIKLLINDENLRKQIGENLKKTINNEFDLDKTAEKLANFYKKIIFR